MPIHADHPSLPVQVIDKASPVVLGEGPAFFLVPNRLTGMELKEVAAGYGSSKGVGTGTMLDVTRQREAVPLSILPAPLTIPDGQWYATGPAAPNMDVTVGDILYVEVTQAQAGALGLGVTLEFGWPGGL